MHRREVLAAGVALLALPWRTAAADQEEKAATYTGKVVPLKDVPAKDRPKGDDKDALALLTDDGKAFALLRNAESALFFSDRALLNRPMRITGRPQSGGQVLRVLEAQSLMNGKPCEVYYWCPI